MRKILGYYCHENNQMWLIAHSMKRDIFVWINQKQNVEFMSYYKALKVVRYYEGKRKVSMQRVYSLD